MHRTDKSVKWCNREMRHARCTYTRERCEVEQINVLFLNTVGCCCVSMKNLSRVENGKFSRWLNLLTCDEYANRILEFSVWYHVTQREIGFQLKITTKTCCTETTEKLCQHSVELLITLKTLEKVFSTCLEKMRVFFRLFTFSRRRRRFGSHSSLSLCAAMQPCNVSHDTRRFSREVNIRRIKWLRSQEDAWVAEIWKFFPPPKRSRWFGKIKIDSIDFFSLPQRERDFSAVVPSREIR